MLFAPKIGLQRCRGFLVFTRHACDFNGFGPNLKGKQVTHHPLDLVGFQAGTKLRNDPG